MATASLLASGVTTGTGGDPLTAPKTFAASIKRDAANEVSALKSVEVKLTQDSEGNITFIHDGKTYNFGSTDIENGDVNLYTNKFGDVTLQIQNSSKRNFVSTHNLKTDNVDLWYIGFADDVANYADRGYAVFGNHSTSVPSNKTIVYKGRVEGYRVNKSNGTQIWIDGASTLNADFEKQTISGKFDNIRSYEFNNTNPKDEPIVANIQNGVISGNGFSGTLDLFENGTEVSVSNNVIKGGFYGSNAAEIGATGQIETDSSVITFGTVAKQ